MVTTILIATGTALLLTFFILLFKLPTKVQYIEEIQIEAPVKKVYDAIRFQEQLMKWSAWPSETNSQCAVKNVDGQIGAQTVYLQKGKAELASDFRGGFAVRPEDSLARSGRSRKRSGVDIHHRQRLGRLDRSEERRVGKECRSRWSPYH